MLIFVRGDVKLTDTISTADLLEALQKALEAPVAAAGARWTDHNLSIRAIDELFPGAAQNDFPLCTTNVPPCASGATYRNTAFKIGPYAGYNVQLGHLWVAGIEADWSWADQTNTQSVFKYFLAVPGFQPDSSIGRSQTPYTTGRGLRASSAKDCSSHAPRRSAAASPPSQCSSHRCSA